MILMRSKSLDRFSSTETTVTVRRKEKKRKVDISAVVDHAVSVESNCNQTMVVEEACKVLSVDHAVSMESNYDETMVVEEACKVLSVDHAVSMESDYDDTMVVEEACRVFSVNVLENIFARLPLKSMIHLRLLSKFWSNHVFSADFRHEVHSFWKKVPPTVEKLRGHLHVEEEDDAYELFDWLFMRHPPPGTIPRPQFAVMTAGWPLPALVDELMIAEFSD